MTGLDAAGVGAEGLDDATLGSLCEHPDSQMTATAVAALSATDRCRCIQSGRPCYSATPDSCGGVIADLGPTNAMQVTPAVAAATFATATTPVARAFGITDVLSVVPNRRRGYQREQ
jgi:hypothetical protein